MNLVERNTSPNGLALVNPNSSGKRGAYDLVELAANIEKADQFTKANAGSKLTVIAEQVRTTIKVQGSQILPEFKSEILEYVIVTFLKLMCKQFSIRRALM